MKKYQPTDLIKFASRTGRWTVKKINNMPTLYTTNLGSYLRFKVSNAKNVKFLFCQIKIPYLLAKCLLFELMAESGNGHKLA